MPHGLLFDRVIHSESTKGFAYTFGKKTSPGFPTDGPRVPLLRSGRGPGMGTSPTRVVPRWVVLKVT